MTLVYSPTTTWPQEMLELYYDAITHDGLHYTLKVGLTSEDIAEYPKAWKARKQLVKPYYKGYTMRYFLFAGQETTETYVGAIYVSPFDVWKCRVLVNNGVVTTESHEDDGIRVGDVKLGDIYTCAIRTDDQRYFTMSFNEKGFNKCDMTEITDRYTYRIWESLGNHTCLTMHFYNPTTNRTPWLGHNLYLEFLPVRLGAYGTYVVEYDGSNEPVTVRARQKPAELQFIFNNNGRLRKYERFHCVVRITAHGLAVSVSFDPNPQVKPAGTALSLLHCYFNYGSILNAHITSP